VWSHPLPMSRHALTEPSSARTVQETSISAGDYFLAVRAFIEGSGQDARALAGMGGNPSTAQTVRIFLAKHGEYYHPARVETEIDGALCRWVVNVAVSAAGRSLLFREYALLQRLTREFAASYVPEAYAAAEVDAGRGRVLAMFLGQWFHGFHEFHATRDTPGGGQALVLWDPEGGPILLDDAQARAVYRQVALILTHYFHLATFEAIGAWHHAAGDFVVRLKEGRPEVRLITVREYRPLFRSRPESGDPSSTVQALLEPVLIFLLNLSIRTRLDRLDGTGDLAWSDPLAVEATVTGVLDGLAEKAPPGELPLPLDALLRRYLAACSGDDLLAMCAAIAAKNYPAGSAAYALIEGRLEEHAATLAGVLNRL
jgi:hypothetical protein